MSNQILISSGAKLRDLDDVIIGTDGVLSSLAFNVANGVPKLDENGKILVSQLPNSVMEFKGVWNAATNTPTLADGTGNAGDVYLCNVAGTVNFGSGPIAFAVGDYAVYTGSVWARSSGATGTVTSVGVSRSGDALAITGSPITTSGTINIGFSGSSTQYINGAGNLTTFPSIISEAQNLVTEVYNETGATLTKGTIVYINGGHGNLPTVTKAIATSDATSAQTYGIVRANITNNNNGYVTVIGSLNDLDTQAYPDGTQLYLSGTTAGAWTSTKPSAPIHLVYVGIVVRSHPTQGVVEVRIQNGYELSELHDVQIIDVANNDGIFYDSATSLWKNKTIAEVLGYTPANAATTLTINGTAYDLSANRTWNVGTVTSVGLSVPTGFSVTGSPVTSTGTLALSFAAGYSLPTNIKQSNWDDAYTWVAAFPTQTGNSGKFLTTDGSTLSWATVIAGVQSVTASSPLSSSGGSTPNITISQATTSTNGYLSSTDWNNFNGKQNALTNPVTGTGTANRLVKFSGTGVVSTVAGSNISDDGTVIEINASHLYASPALKLWNDVLLYNTLYFTDSTYTVQSKISSSSGALFIDVNSATRALTISSTAISTFEGQVIAPSGKFWDGTQGLVVRAYSSGAGYGAIYFTGVTASSTNYALLTSGATTYLNGTSNLGLNIGDSVKLFVSTAGKVGIGTGTTTPSALLHVSDTSSTTVAMFESPSAANVFIALKTTAGTNYLGNVNGNYSFETGGSEKMSLSTSGNLFVGSFPHNTYGRVNIKSNSTTSYMGLNVYANANDRFIAVNHTGTVGIIETENAGSSVMTDLVFRVNSTDMIKLTTGGAVYVKTTGITGGGALQVNGNVNINGVFQINGVTIGGGGGSGVTGSGTTGYVPKWSSSSAISNSLIYDTGTNIGIGTTSPNRTFEVISGNGVHNGMRITYAAGVTGEGMDITYNNTGATTTRFDSIYDSNNALMQFRMRTSNASPSNPLSLLGDGKVIVNGTSAISVGRMSIYAGGAAGVAWGSGLNIGDSSNYMGFIQDAGISRLRNFANGGIEFFNSAASQIMILKDNGNVLIGFGTDAGYRLQVNGNMYVSGSAVYAGGVTYASTQTFNGLVYLNSTTYVGTYQNIIWSGVSSGYDFSMGNGGYGMYILSSTAIDLNAPIVQRYGVGYSFAGNGSSAYNVLLLNSGTSIDEITILGGIKLSTTTAGLIPPRMTTTQLNALSARGSTYCPNGTTVFDTTINILRTWNGSAWMNLW